MVDEPVSRPHASQDSAAETGVPVGHPVRVRMLMPPGHVRAPVYLRGKIGVIERPLGAFGNPEEQAYGRIGNTKHLYRVRFSMAELWGAQAEAPDDQVDAEIYAHWLEEVG